VYIKTEVTSTKLMGSDAGGREPSGGQGSGRPGGEPQAGREGHQPLEAQAPAERAGEEFQLPTLRRVG